MTDATLKDHVSSHTKCFKKLLKIADPGAPLGAHCDFERPAREAFDEVCTSLWRLRVVFLTICAEKLDLLGLLDFDVSLQ